MISFLATKSSTRFLIDDVCLFGSAWTAVPRQHCEDDVFAFHVQIDTREVNGAKSRQRRFTLL